MLTKDKADRIGLAIIADGDGIKEYAKVIQKFAYGIGMQLYNRELEEADVEALERSLQHIDYYIEHITGTVDALRSEIQQNKFDQMTIEE